MRMFYCPVCHKEEIKKDYPLRSSITFVNTRDGYGRPIVHYKCECGNLLAGSIDITGYENDNYLLQYSKVLIEGYNKDGRYYTDGLYEAIEERSR